MKKRRHPIGEREMLFLDYVSLFLGAWTVSNSFTLHYQSSEFLRYDLTLGILIIAFSGLRILTRSPLLLWANVLCGLWLIFSPLIFWAHTSGPFSEDMLLGTLLILTNTIHLGRSVFSECLSEIPMGWDYNPSAWSQRVPIVSLALIGFFSARYLAAYQLGQIPEVWDPFFGNGTAQTLNSDVSRVFPVSDAGLGAVSYLLDALSGVIGDKRRWRSMPWMVILFGLMIIPPGIISIALVVLQPVAVGNWCTLCLFTAFIMLQMVTPALDEVIASIQFLSQTRKKGKSVWQTFWKGDQPSRIAELVVTPPRPKAPILLSIQHIPWNLVGCLGAGIWLMFTPKIFGLVGFAAHSVYLIAALTITASIISLGEVGRPFRWSLIPLSAFLLGTSLFSLPFFSLSQGNGILFSTFTFLLCIPRGFVSRSYGTYDRWINWSPFPKQKRRFEKKPKAA